MTDTPLDNVEEQVEEAAAEEAVADPIAELTLQRDEYLDARQRRKA